MSSAETNKWNSLSFIHAVCRLRRFERAHHVSGTTTASTTKVIVTVSSKEMVSFVHFMSNFPQQSVALIVNFFRRMHIFWKETYNGMKVGGVPRMMMRRSEEEYDTAPSRTPLQLWLQLKNGTRLRTVSSLSGAIGYVPAPQSRFINREWVEALCIHHPEVAEVCLEDFSRSMMDLIIPDAEDRLRIFLFAIQSGHLHLIELLYNRFNIPSRLKDASFTVESLVLTAAQCGGSVSPEVVKLLHSISGSPSSADTSTASRRVVRRSMDRGDLITMLPLSEWNE